MAAKGQQTKACHVQQDATPKEVRYLKYLYFVDENLSQGRTCQHLNAEHVSTINADAENTDSIECITFILVHLCAHMSVFLVWFYKRGVKNSQNNKLFVMSELCQILNFRKN